MLKKSLFTITLLMLAGIMKSQEEQLKQYPSIAGGAGVLTFNGHVGTPFSTLRAGYNLTVEQRMGNHLGVSLNGMYGELLGNDLGSPNLNFESQLMQGDLNLVYHFDNASSEKVLGTYLSAGCGFLSFNCYGDLYDKNGIKYNYWTDGTIRNLPQNSPSSANAVIITRSYKYDTKLANGSAIMVPVGAGVNIKTGTHFHIKVGVTYYYALSNAIDNYKSGANESYLYANVSLQYSFVHKKTTVFSAIENSDMDQDKVLDIDDRCPGTPLGVKTDSHGCPVDTDEDAVPDYLDKEPHSAKGVIVDQNGVTQTDEMIANRKKQFDSLASGRLQSFVKSYPSVNPIETTTINTGKKSNPTPTPSGNIPSELKSTDKNNGQLQSFVKNTPNVNPTETTTINTGKKGNPTPSGTIPAEFKFMDKNNDGKISLDEISKAIEAFFDGDPNYTVEKLNRLIDYFFEQ